MTVHGITLVLTVIFLSLATGASIEQSSGTPVPVAWLNLVLLDSSLQAKALGETLSIKIGRSHGGVPRSLKFSNPEPREAHARTLPDTGFKARFEPLQKIPPYSPSGHPPLPTGDKAGHAAHSYYKPSHDLALLESLRIPKPNRKNLRKKGSSARDSS